MQKYWVVGGEYHDTKFKDPVPGRKECVGPFDSYDQAMAEWTRRAWHTVDEAHTRYRIECVDKDEAPPCTD